jgi:hypothetical protein
MKLLKRTAQFKLKPHEPRVLLVNFETVTKALKLSLKRHHGLNQIFKLELGLMLKLESLQLFAVKDVKGLRRLALGFRVRVICPCLENQQFP